MSVKAGSQAGRGKSKSRAVAGVGTARKSAKKAPASGADAAPDVASVAFSPETMRFLRGIARNNDREWFGERREIYERALRAPMLALAGEINARLAEFAPANIRTPAKAVMRFYRDTRFSNDKRPYKTHLSAWWGHAKLEKTSGAGFYLQISPKEVHIAAGCFMPTREQLLALRRHLVENHEEWRKLLALSSLRKLGLKEEAAPPALTRVPKGFSADHPSADLVRQQRWGVEAYLPAEAALAPDFADVIESHLRASAPLVEFLNRPFTAAPARPSVNKLLSSIW